MTPQEAKDQYGATHYITMRDGVTPQMYYKQETIPINDGTTHTGWRYLSFCNLWQGSSITKDEEHRLIPIEEGTSNASKESQ